MSDETFSETFDDGFDEPSTTDYSSFPRTLTHSRELVQYVNRFQTYPSNNSRSLALYIADFYNPQMGYSFPSQEKMATSFSTNPKTIRRWLKEIESTGYWIFRKGGKDNSTRYIPADKELAAVNKFLRAESRHERTGDENKKVMPNQARNDNFIKEEEHQSSPEQVEEKVESPAPAVYEPSPLPDIFPADLATLYKKMLYNGNISFPHPDSFDKLNHLQTDLIVTMISHLVHSHIIRDTAASKTAKLIADIWVANPETEADAFYNRTMHYLYKNNAEVASFVP